MKRKARIQTGIDDRLVAIYARKSRITNKGDSIGVQFKQSADYAINQLSLPEDYEFARYEDKGLSGYYSDRPDFQRLLRDIEMGKIKAVACYKLDRISRKTSDLMRLLEYFERHDVTLLVCSNNINTRISTSKIIIQVLAIIAEFERDILTERIQDNLMELAKDGRWLGGKTPTGFSSQRVTTGSGKNKSAISFLVPVQEEKEIVLEIYGTFWETRSLLQTANIINEKYETKHGAKFTTSAIRLILRNPIYCVADEYSYNYFLEHDGNLFGEPSDFDGQHGLTAYNKTDQMKVEDEDSTFFNPKFSQLLTRKPISEWIVSVGRHEGFISSRKWVETQNMLDEIAEKYNRPHRKTNALLSGLMYCPICGKRLRVLPESNRWTNGKPRFKYACPGVRAKECTFKGVEGVTLDEFVIHSLSSLQEEHSDYYRQLLENRVASMIRTDQSEKEYQETKKAIERLNADIAAQVRNLREADDALKRFIQDDIKELTDELAKREAALRRMEDTQSENQYLIHELNGMKKRLLSFEEFAKGAQPEALFTLVHSIVDRIYITTDGTKQKCQVYIKGCATEDYSDVLGAAGYIEEEPLLPVASYVPPMCDLDYYSISAERNAQFKSESVARFIKYMETERSYNGAPVSIRYLIGNKDALILAIKEGRQVCEPYIQMVTGDRDEHSGFKLSDIWRYFRYTWSIPYKTMPGRNIYYLVRDRLQPYHPIIGIFALGNSVLNLTVRDDDIGWTVEAIKKELSQRVHTEYCEQTVSGTDGKTVKVKIQAPIETDEEYLKRRQAYADRLFPLLVKNVNTAISEIYTGDLGYYKQTKYPHREQVDELYAIAAEYSERSINNRNNEIAPDWREEARSNLFKRKRASELAKLLETKIAFNNAVGQSNEDKLLSLLASEAGRKAIYTALIANRKCKIGSNMMDIIVCGSIPPYNQLLGGKLVSILACSPRVISDYTHRYERQISEIASRMKGERVIRDSHLVYLGTTSLYAVGSSQYNRIKVPLNNGSLLEFREMGVTEGYGTVFFSKETTALFSKILELQDGGKRINHVFGEGTSPRFRMISRGLSSIGIRADAFLKHFFINSIDVTLKEEIPSDTVDECQRWIDSMVFSSVNREESISI